MLVAPEIPQNTGNIIRLCANTGACLNLVKPLGFELSQPALQRASLDYSDIADVVVHDNFASFSQDWAVGRRLCATTDGGVRYDTHAYREGDALVFGSESVGLPDELIQTLPAQNRLRIPMTPSNRSMNLSNAVAVMVYEMWRQIGFTGAVTEKSGDYFA